jgi:ELWxxDGT repeat protein
MRFESLERRTMLAADFELVKDIHAAPQSLGLSPSGFLEVEGVAYFSASTPTYGFELWRTDGTAEGTYLVRDVNPGSQSSMPQSLTEMGGDVYFVANDGVNRQEIWKSDGTAAGTFMLTSFSTASGTLPLLSLGVVGETLFISAYDSQWGVWKSDGTVEGTVKLQAFGGDFPGSKPDNFTAVGDVVYFSADDGVSGAELWKSDGTAEGTVRVKDILPGTNGSTPTSLFNHQGTLYFAASDGVHGSELWRTDGTEAGTMQIKDIVPGSEASLPTKFIAVNDILYFLAEDDPFQDLWRTDGTAAGTVEVYGAVRELIEFDGALFAFGSGSIVRSDGTTAGTELVGLFGWPNFGAEIQPVVAGDFIYFVGHSNAEGNEVWLTDGTQAGTHVLKDLNTTLGGSRDDIKLSTLGDTLLFRAFSTLSGTDLWKSDGTGAGTTLVRPISPATASSNPRDLTEFNGALYFFARNADGEALWRSDGTTGGTVALKNFKAGLIQNHRLTVAGDRLYFVANDGTTGYELWKTDGTAEGTAIVEEIVPGSSGSFSQLTEDERFASVGDFLYFTIIRNGKVELWKSNGDADGATLLKIFNSALPGNVGQLTNVDGRLVFVGYESSTGRELWTSDGTPDGTVRLSDIWAGPSSSIGTASVPLLFNVGGTVLFAAENPATGRELWKWDSVGGIAIVNDVVPGSGSSIPPFSSLAAGGWTVAGGTLYFASNAGFGSSSGVMELWKSDGTAAGTVLVKDIQPGSGGGFPEQLTAVGGNVYFTANDGVHGRELWTSDGTEAGTYMVHEFVPGSLSRAITGLTEAGGKLYFSVAIDGVGDELWCVEGANGARLVGDITRDGGGSMPAEVTAVGNRLFLAATTTATGRELWTLDLSTLDSIAGDYDGDHVVDGSDFLAWQRSFGSAITPAGGDADGNGSGVVEAGDLAVWKSNFGQVVVEESSTTASESLAAIDELYAAADLNSLFSAGDFTSLFSASDSPQPAGRRRLPRLMRL